jgi:hypothetical protein
MPRRKSWNRRNEVPKPKLKIKQAVSPLITEGIQKATQWLLSEEGFGQRPVDAARIFHLPDPQKHTHTIRMQVKRARTAERNSRGEINKHGGENKMLDSKQEEIIVLYCREHAINNGLGATKTMVRVAIAYMLSQQSIPRDPPSDDWYTRWFKKMYYEKRLHTIKTKPIARQRVDTHSEPDIVRWFEDE